ncbi:MAG: hypothetical protein PHC88_12600 [Terrimicrobiaceae bacterium]|nr:hypothetical protein [Terrimicrobiaceae bacterium]
MATAQAGVSWEFAPPQAGNALYEGGWTVGYSLGAIQASPEFSFSLQLIYLNSRDQVGLFGAQWFCPQLESALIPRAAGVFVWIMPNGGVVPLQADPKHPADFRTSNGEWHAKVAGGRQTVSNEEGWQFVYARGRLSAATSPTGRVLDFVRAGDQLSYVQLRDSASGAVQVLCRFGYAEGGRRVAQLQVDGNLHRFEYRKDGATDRLAGWLQQLGWPMQFRYDPKIGALAASAINRAGAMDVAEFRIEYAPPGDPKEESPARHRDCASYRLAADRDYAYAYPAPGSIELTRRSDGSKTSGSYQAGRGVLATGGAGAANRRTIYYRAPGKSYDGRLRRVEEDKRIVAEYRYDRKTGALKEIIDENGLSTFFDYAPGPRTRWEPKPIRVRRGTRRANVVIAEYAYDAAGRLLASKDAGGRVTRLTYTPRGELASVTDAAGGKSTFDYDALGRVVAVARNGAVEKTAYDAQGRIAVRTAPDGSKTTLLYDGNGRVTGVQRDGKTLVTYRRDSLGRIAEEIDPLGRAKKYDYDARGNVLAEHAANGSVTRYAYDARDRRVAQIDGNGNRIAFDYDPAGHLSKQTNALGDVLAWTYDARGKLAARANGVQNTLYTYDARNRLARVDFSGRPAAPPAQAKATPSAADFFANTAAMAAASSPAAHAPAPAPAATPPPPAAAPSQPATPQTVDYSYDREGRVLSAATPDAQFEYLRDAQGRVEALRCVAGGREQLVRYRYDAVGRRTGLILAELRAAVAPAAGHPGREESFTPIDQFEYSYDTGGRLTGISSGGSQVVGYAYDSAGRLTRRDFANGISQVVKHDAGGRLSSITFSGGPLGEAPLTLRYFWDDADQVTAREWNGQRQEFTYDKSGQLLTVSASGAVLESYKYDPAGNIIEKTINGETVVMTYDAANQLATFIKKSPSSSNAASIRVAYDAAGRLTKDVDGSRITFGWLDRPIKTTLPNGTEIAYDYYPDGQIAVKRTEARAKAARNTKDEFQKIANFSSAPSLVKPEVYLWDGLALLRRGDEIFINEPHPSGGAVVASYLLSGRKQSLTFYLNDLLGTTLATVRGSKVEFKPLTAFGQPLKAGGAAPASSASPPSASVPPNDPLPSLPTMPSPSN